VARLVFKFKDNPLSAIERMRENLRRPDKKVMPMIGALVKAQTLNHFRNQGTRDEDWPPRMTPNIPGIIRDLARSPQIKARRFQPRPALRDTGALMRSIDFELTGRNSVTIGSALPYAGTQQYGGESESDPITPMVQANLGIYLKSHKNQRGALGWMMNKKFTGKTLTINVQERPFLDISEDEMQEIIDMLAFEVVR
jgi:phage gpG-like protein